MSSLRQFKYLISIVEEGGFIAASEKLYIAQSALSRQMKLLEQELGFEIFDRSEKKSKLTPAGQVLYEKIKNQLEMINHSVAVAESVAAGEGRMIRMAHSSSIVMDQRKINILDMLSQHCQVRVEINTLSSELQIAALLAGNIDLGFIRTPVFHSLDEINSQSLYAAPVLVAVSRDDPRFLDQREIDFDALSNCEFVATPQSGRGGLSYLAANLCLSHGFHPKKARMTSRKISQLHLVANGLGVCIVPQEFESILPERVKLLTLEQGQHASEVSLIWRKDQDQRIQQCAAFVIQQFKN